MKRSEITRETVGQFAEASAWASALLERRVVPAGFVRSGRVKQFLAERQSKLA